MIRITDKAQCSGCTACSAACPVDAITMVPDALGFEYPSVDPDRCVDCGLCEKICPFRNGLSRSQGDAYAVRHKDAAVLASSQSGGAFAALADTMLGKGGEVWGAAFEDDFSVAHRKADSQEELEALKGSKYVQSRMGGCLKEIREDLKNGREVLFSGTPCQVAAARAVCGNCSGLTTVDLVCHGVPSPAVWAGYLELREKKAGKKILKATFRDKTKFGWKKQFETLHFEGGSSLSSRSFADLFYKDIMLRPSCGSCPFSSLERVSDITVGDLWGCADVAPEMDRDDKGVSLLTANTGKGRALLDGSLADIDVKRIDIRKCQQRALVSPTDISPDAAAFEKDFTSKGMARVLRRYGDWNIRSRAGYFYRKARNLARKILLGK